MPDTVPMPDTASPWPDLLGPGIAWHGLAIGETPWPLHPDEAAAVAHAVPGRRQEFAAGRHCARLAQLALRGHAEPVLAGPDRAPRWPAGLVGSISHDAGIAVAAVAHAAAVLSLGIDLDQWARFDLRLAAQICGPAERARLAAAGGPAAQQRQLAMLFCAKEAVYKAQHPLTGAWLDFADLDLQLPAVAAVGAVGHFSATLQRAAGHFGAGHGWQGRCAWQAGRCHAAVVLRA